MEKTKKLLSLFFGIPLTLLSLIFIGKIFYDSRDTLALSFTHVNIPLFLIGIVFFTLFFLIKGIAWLEILKRSGHENVSRNTLFAYSFAETKRYIPGNVFGFAARIQNLAPHLPRSKIIKGIGIEAFLFVVSAAIISLPSLFYFSGKTIQFLSIPPVPFFTLLISVVGIVFFGLFMKFPRLFESYFSVFSILLLGWILFGIASLFTALSFSFINPDNFLTVISYFVFSWFVGYLAFVVPMGIGIRELVIVGGLSFFVSVPVATIIALFTRIGMILGELLMLVVSYILKRLKPNSFILRQNPVVILLFISIFCFIAYFTFFTFLRHETFRSGRFDLGNMSQTVWNTAHGRFFQLTNPDGTEIISRLGVHADFILILLAPFYYIWSDPRTLLIIQTVIVAFGAFYVYEIAVTLLKKERLSLLIAITYLFNFWVQEQVIFDFHAVTLATTFLLAAFYYLLVKERKSFILFLVLALLTKENVYLISALFGLFLIFRKQYIAGFSLFIVSIVIFYLLMTYFIPGARGTNHFALSYLSYLGGSTGEIITNLITKPQIIMSVIFSFETLKYIETLLLPLGFLSIFSPFLLFFAAPDIAINILSTNVNLRSYEYHYGALIIPFVYITAIYGIRFLIKRKIPVAFITIYLVIMTAISTYYYSPLPGMREGDIGPFVQNNQKIHEYLKIIPASATVAASNNVAAHLSHREYIYVVPHGIDKAEYVVFYHENPEVQSMLNPLDFTLLIQDGDFYLYKKGASICKHCKP